jgi:molybdopterin/thiamine biosynthesis adenylyltransferase
MGGVGGVHLATLGRLGIGRFTIGDMDRFEVANFNRQYGAKTTTLNRPKVEVMAEEVRQINPEADVRVFHQGVEPGKVSEFLEGVDLFVDGIDFFSIDIRRRLFREAAARNIFAVTAAPLGFGAAWLVFDPRGMSFDEYFDFREGQEPMEQLIAFAVGLAPAALHRDYFDWSKVNLAEHRGPSSGLACQLCAGVVAAESLKILLGRGEIRCAPCYVQFDAYRGELQTGRLDQGNREPAQLQKRAAMSQWLATLTR